MGKNDVKSNYLATAGLVAIVMLMIFFSRKDPNKTEEDRKSFKGEAVGLTTRFKYGRKVIYLQYYFYLDKKIISKISVDKYDSTLLNKFYKVKYDLNKPEESDLVLEEELQPDSLTLVKAGFRKTKYYFYDAGVTCKYIEKEKWK
ncbi:hypothetical protein [Flavobacterium branchiicola]|uniref:Uncharacterized protein n=1 Tax=Flavobacterium branchiicola TaxID=1114875 RepID=A0ABV9P6W7_9FLAO|nr:hypothetical protein [Flavobacterium branchiicola]MBS7252826.1 hypothetical protein [Flavobacterium branchiicola]